jgi:hypothetical protein
MAWRPSPAAKNDLRGPRQHARDDAVVLSAAASRRHGIAGDLEGATEEVPSKEERVGAHQNGGPMVRRRKRRRAVAFTDDGVAPMVIDERGEVLQLEGDQRGEEAVVD